MRFESLYEWVRTNPASLWAERVLLDLKHSRKNTRIFSYEGMGIGPRYRIMTTRSGFTRLDNEAVLEAFQKAQRRLILLDIGGTLVHQVKVDSLDMFSKSNTAATKVTSIREDHTPPVAPGRPPRAVMTALRALAADTRRNAVYLVSGQDRATVASHFETIPRLGIVTDSGYSFRNAGEDMWETMDEHFDLSWVETVTEIMKIYMLRTVGTYMERKKFAVLWRFADADPDYGALQVRYDALAKIVFGFLSPFAFVCCRLGYSLFLRGFHQNPVLMRRTRAPVYAHTLVIPHALTAPYAQLPIQQQHTGQ